jgi:type II restriction/modification system DNA methylase subunit YeeA
MPVNTAALKTYAPAMRRQLLEAVGRKLDLLLHSQTPDTLSTYSKQIAELREQEAENREQLLEKVAYTWFNRLSALRYLDARGWHPFGCKVLMPAAEGETQPELLKLMRAGSLPAELKSHTNETRLHGLLDGQIPPAVAGADPQGEVYRELVLASCRSYHQLLPELFEGLDDASELLLPDDLLSEGSIAGGFRTAISDVDCEDVEIIGWLYQFYISEKKDQVIGKVVKSEDIPAATQLFTPNWIVKYMVQNSLGATWLATYPDSPLKGQMEFYIEPAKQTSEVQAQLAAITPESLDPEELTLIDPACGSGHILVEAYDLLKAIYLERGYRQRDIPELILTKNIYGLDICPRAAQLAAFSLLMKGREDDRRLLERGITLNVMALQDSIGLNVDRLAASVDLSTSRVSRADLQMLVELFIHATTLGTLIKVPATLAKKIPDLSILARTKSQDLFTADDLQRLIGLVRQAAILARQYDAVATNPPYMGSKFHIPVLKSFLKNHYNGYEKDVFSAFFDRNLVLSKPYGRLALMSPFVWMFISSYEGLRKRLIGQETIASLVQLEYSGFEGATVPICSFILRRLHVARQKGCFIRLSDFRGSANQAPKTLEAIRNRQCSWFYEVAQDEFEKIPGSPVAYWLGQQEFAAFESFDRFQITGNPRVGMQTSNNNKYLRLWWEINHEELVNRDRHGNKWIKYLKGGGFRRWAGNLEYLLHYNNDPQYILQQPNAQVMPLSTLEKPKGTWGSVTSSRFSCREAPPDTFHDIGGHCFYPRSEDMPWLLGFLNSKVAERFLGVINPTLNYQVTDVGRLPLTNTQSNTYEEVKLLTEISTFDWNAYERSWDFRGLPLLNGADRFLAQAYSNLIDNNRAQIAKTQELELKNNSLFIKTYGLNNELTPEVSIEQITLTVNPAYRYGGNLSEDEQWERFRRDTMSEFLSYATGCMVGRYSLDQPGLILADSRDSQADHLAAYEERLGKPITEARFKPDPDGIIPVLDGEWFEDDIVARTREFLEVTFPESTVTENLRFIEESLGKDIRKYFCSDFYKDHLQTYKKRPIYWMVQSPKKGFGCLIYLHRYTKDTLNQVLNNYFRPYLQKLEARLAQLGLDQLNDSLPTRDRTAARKEAEKITKVLKECQAWEQDALLPLAQQRIELDLDDGVKVNYLKLQDVLAPIPGLAAKED